MTTPQPTTKPAHSNAAATSVRRAARAVPLLTLLAAAAVMVGPSGTAALQEPADSALAKPQRSYPAGSLHRFLLGSNYRDLWDLAIRVPVLDLDRFEGGIVPTELGGGQQTASLRFINPAGVEYAFRVIDKDASRTLDPALRQSIAARVLQDQISALLPGAALVVSEILTAVDVLHPEPRLFVMPDDPRLGEFRDQFAGVLGTIEDRPDEGPDGEPGFGGSSLVVGSESFFERIEEDPSNRLDVAAYIRARLIDAYVGDWDRHPDQWRWAAFPENGGLRWEPVPRDRDWALASLEGLLIWITGFAFPNYVGFDDEYPSAFRLSWTARVLDRQLASAADGALWDSVATEIVRQVDDATIDRAVNRLPAEYRERIGAELTAALRARRDDLPRLAREFYALLAGWVDVHATDVAEAATLERRADGSVRLEIARREGDAAAGPAFFARTFEPSETHEIRLYMHGEDDRVTVTGTNGGITIRVIGGGSDDTLIDTTSGSDVYFYDDRGDNTFTAAGRTRIDTAEYEPPAVSEETAQAPPRDWGSFWIPVPFIAYEPDIGFYLGMGANRYGYGFRYAPWKTRLAFSAGYGSGAGGFRGFIDYDFPLRGAVRARVIARYTDADRDNFFGFGNETSADSASSFYRADRRDFGLTAAATVRPSPGTELSIGPVLRMTRPFRQAGTLVADLDPYGRGNYSELGIQGSVMRDTRNHLTAATRGTLLRVSGRYFASAMDVEDAFGGIRGEAAVYLAPDTIGTVVLALRAVGEKLWGPVPYHEAAYLGGSTTLRGFSNRRFAGEASAVGNAELRLPVASFFLTLPAHFGVFGVADAGRVFVSGESSDSWHTAFGGGIWLAALHPANVMTLAVVRGEDRTGLYLKAGFQF